MCDADSYATGVLLTQISVGLLTSVLLNTVAKNANQILPSAKAVPVSIPVAEAVQENNAEEGMAGVVPVVPPVERFGQTLRRRAVEGRRAKNTDFVTILVNAKLAKNMKFNF